MKSYILLYDLSILLIINSTNLSSREICRSDKFFNIIANSHFKKLEKIQLETVIKIDGKVVERSKDTINKDIETGEIEVEIKNFQAKAEDSGNIFIKGSLPFYGENDSKKSKINLITNNFSIKTENFNFLVDSDIKLKGSFNRPVLGGNLSLNNGYISFNGSNQNNKVDKKNNLLDLPNYLQSNQLFETDYNLECSLIGFFYFHLQKIIDLKSLHKKLQFL